MSEDICASCNKPIFGHVISALNKTWHPEHFVCEKCKQEFSTGGFLEMEGRPYCEKDYHELFSQRCAKCNEPISTQGVNALGKYYHPEHFTCFTCGKQIDSGFREKDGEPYCNEDFAKLFAPKCAGCAKPILENYITALNDTWHQSCFVCSQCKQSFGGASFFMLEGKPICASCMQKQK